MVYILRVFLLFLIKHYLPLADKLAVLVELGKVQPLLGLDTEVGILPVVSDTGVGPFQDLFLVVLDIWHHRTMVEQFLLLFCLSSLSWSRSLII